jgi:periplasmic divalent cation tolerance protein
VTTSLPDKHAANELAKRLIDAHLAACVQIHSGVQSVYCWDGRVCEEQEVVLVAKTTAEQWAAIAAFIKRNHPYDVPEIIGQSITHCNDAYAEWVSAEIKDASA